MASEMAKSDELTIIEEDYLSAAGEQNTKQNTCNNCGHSSCTQFWFIDGEPRGYCLIINNNSTDDHHERQTDLQKIIQTKFKFLTSKWSQLDCHKLHRIFEFLIEAQCPYLMIILLSAEQTQQDSSVQSASLKSLLKAVTIARDCTRSELRQYPVLLLCDVSCSEGNSNSSAAIEEEPIKLLNLNQFVFTQSSQADPLSGIKQFFEEALKLPNEECLPTKISQCLIEQKISHKFVPALHSSANGLQCVIPCCQTQEYMMESHQEVGGYGLTIEYKETAIRLMIWTLIVCQQLRASKDRIVRLTEIARKKKVACAMNSLITSILTFATFISLLLIDIRNPQRTNYQEVFGILFGASLQVLALIGNVYSVVCFVKKYRAFKSEINMVLEYTKKHFDSVCEKENGIIGDKQASFILKDVTRDGLSMIRSVAFLTIFSAQLGIKLVRIFTIGLRVMVVVALIGSVLCAPLDVIEIIHFIRSQNKPSKLVNRFDEFAQKLMQKINEVNEKSLDESIKELYQKEQSKIQEKLQQDVPDKCMISELPFERRI